MEWDRPVEELPVGVQQPCALEVTPDEKVVRGVPENHGVALLEEFSLFLEQRRGALTDFKLLHEVEIGSLGETAATSEEQQRHSGNSLPAVLDAHYAASFSPVVGNPQASRVAFPRHCVVAYRWNSSRPASGSWRGGRSTV